MASLFHVYFPGKSFELDSSRFIQVDTQRWVMNMSMYVGEVWCYDLLFEAHGLLAQFASKESGHLAKLQNVSFQAPMKTLMLVEETCCRGGSSKCQSIL